MQLKVPQRFSANSFPWIRFSIYQANMPLDKYKTLKKVCDQIRCSDFGGCAQRQLADGTNARAPDNNIHVKLSIFSARSLLYWNMVRTIYDSGAWRQLVCGHTWMKRKYWSLQTNSQIIHSIWFSIKNNQKILGFLPIENAPEKFHLRSLYPKMHKTRAHMCVNELQKKGSPIKGR